MVKGRKPDAKAVRRKSAPPVELAAEPMGMRKLRKPDAVLANPTMSACWDSIVGDGFQYDEADLPQLEQLCYWFAVYRQCMANTVMSDGRVVTKVGRTVDDGKGGRQLDPMSTKTHPDIRTAKEASTMFRALASELGVSPLARQKMGLMEAVTHSTQADLVRKTEELFARFKGRLDAPNENQ